MNIPPHSVYQNYDERPHAPSETDSLWTAATWYSRSEAEAKYSSHVCLANNLEGVSSKESGESA